MHDRLTVLKGGNDEIFISGASVDDVQVIDAITASRIQATGNVVNTTSTNLASESASASGTSTTVNTSTNTVTGTTTGTSILAYTSHCAIATCSGFRNKDGQYDIQVHPSFHEQYPQRDEQSAAAFMNKQIESVILKF